MAALILATIETYVHIGWLTGVWLCVCMLGVYSTMLSYITTINVNAERQCYSSLVICQMYKLYIYVYYTINGL